MREQFMAILGRSPLVSGTLCALAITSLVACYQFQIDTLQKWCDQLSVTNLEGKYRPFWAVFFETSIDAEAIRDDFVAILNGAHMQKVEHRSPRMAWREGTAFHLINLSTLLVIQHHDLIVEWRDGIEKAKTYSYTDKTDVCLYGTVVSLFDSVSIHSIELDDRGRDKKDQITTIETDRAARSAKVGKKPI